MNPFWEKGEPIERNFEPILRLYQNWLSYTEKANSYELAFSHSIELKGGDGVRIYTKEEFMQSSKTMHVFKCCGTAGIKSIEPLHTHEFIEIVYVLSGAMVHIIDGQRYDVGRGDLLFMNHGCVHEFSCEGEYSYINILFSPEVVSEDIVTPSNAFSVLSLTAFNDMRGNVDFGKISFYSSERDEIENIISAMLKEYKEKRISWEAVLGNYLSTLVVKMLRRTEVGIAPEEICDVWQELSEYIDKNLNSKLTLSQLAQKCFYNPSYFSRIFKEKFGVTFVEYVTQKRLTYAIDLLENTDFSINEIAITSGFSDSKSFYHAFAQKMNCTPAQYRINKGKKTE